MYPPVKYNFIYFLNNTFKMLIHVTRHSQHVGRGTTLLTIRVRDCDQSLDCVNVFSLHLGDRGVGCEESEPGQGLDVSVSLQLRTIEYQLNFTLKVQDICLFVLDA